MTAEHRRQPNAACCGPQQRRPRNADASRRHSRGLATLEWLLVIAAAGGFAAAITAGLDRLIADQTDLADTATDDAHVEARIAAARIDDRALTALIKHSTALAAADTAAAEAAQARLNVLRAACTGLSLAYPAAVRTSAWTWLGVPAHDLHDTPPTAAAAAAAGQVSDGQDGKPSETEDEDDRSAADGRWACRLSGPEQ